MKTMRISTPLNLHAYPRTDISAYIRQGLLFNKQAGFEATDFTGSLVDLTKDKWQAPAACLLSYFRHHLALFFLLWYKGDSNL